MRKQQILTLSAVASMVFASGCTSLAADNKSMVAGSDSSSMIELQAAQRRVNELETSLAERDRNLADAQARLVNADSGASTASADTSLFPPNPKAGECYARVLIPAQYKTVTENVLTKDAAERIEIIPAKYTTAQENVLIKEASTKLEIIPAVYEEVQERVVVKPATQKIVEVPAKYDTVTEQVVETPAHTAWKKGPAVYQSANVISQSTSDTGEIMCLIEVPATYKTVQKRVLVSPARTETVEIPAEYKSVTKRVVKQPARTREIAVPAQYDTMQVTKVASPASEKRIAIPATYDAVSRSEKVGTERMEWRQVMCEVNLTKPSVIAMQKSLADKGYYKAGIDGVIGRQTLDAARDFALANNLPAGSNYIPVQVFKKLN